MPPENDRMVFGNDVFEFACLNFSVGGSYDLSIFDVLDSLKEHNL